MSIPLFSLIYFILSWIFIFCFIVFAIYHGYYKENYSSLSHFQAGYAPLGADVPKGFTDDDDEPEDEALHKFIKNSLE